MTITRVLMAQIEKQKQDILKYKEEINKNYIDIEEIGKLYEEYKEKLFKKENEFYDLECCLIERKDKIKKLEEYLKESDNKIIELEDFKRSLEQSNENQSNIEDNTIKCDEV